MPYAYQGTDGTDALAIWQQARKQMCRHGMNPELLELAGDLATEIRAKDADEPPAVLLARLAARLNGLVALFYGSQEAELEPMPPDFITTLIGITAAVLADVG